MGAGVSFSGVKRPGGGVDHPPSSNVEVKDIKTMPVPLLWSYDMFQGEIHLSLLPHGICGGQSRTGMTPYYFHNTLDFRFHLKFLYVGSVFMAAYTVHSCSASWIINFKFYELAGHVSSIHLLSQQIQSSRTVAFKWAIPCVAWKGLTFRPLDVIFTNRNGVIWICWHSAVK
jgi:hypothetical protein